MTAPAPIAGVEPLMRISASAIHSVVIDFIELDYGRRIMDVVLLRGIAGPVATGGIDLYHH
jgi:hypothetical protein